MNENLPTVVIPPDAVFGPAMEALTERQRRFVLAMLEDGGVKSNSEYARAAGFTGSPATLAVTAHRVAHDPKVLDAIVEEGTKRMHSGVVVAVSELVRLCKHALKDGDKLKAIDMLLNRTGLHAKTEHKLTVRKESNEAEMIESITKLAVEFGMDPAKLIGRTQIIDAEFKEVTPAAPAEEDWSALPEENDDDDSDG
jgi:phage terminase small subunit